MKSKYAVLITLGFTLSLFFFLIWWIPPRADAFIAFSEAHRFIGPVLVILWRILAIVVPPIPGGIISFALIPVFGWFWSFVYATIGLLIGTSIAFWLARRFREPLAQRFVPLRELHQWEQKFSQRMEFFAFLGIRFTTGPIMDFISYAAGLSSISFRKFFLVTFISLLPDSISFYIGGAIYEAFYNQGAYLAFFLLISFASALFFLRKGSPFMKGNK